MVPGDPHILHMHSELIVGCLQCGGSIWDLFANSVFIPKE